MSALQNQFTSATAQQATNPLGEVYVFPVSFAQQWLWFLHQLEPELTAYNTTHAFRVQGVLHIAALRQSFLTIVDRHESQRTTFALVDDIPHQVINPAPVAWYLPVIDLCSLTPAQQHVSVQQLAAAEMQRPFDLTQDFMVRTQLLQLADQEHILLITHHHIASDGWSRRVFWRELSALYGAFTQGAPSPLPQMSIQYADYAMWQRDYLQGAVLERQLAYWQKALAGAPPLLDLPADHPRPAQPSFRGAAVSMVLEADLTHQLRHLSRTQSTTLFMTLLAAFQVLLMRYTGQTDVVIGSPIANRTRQELEPLIGFFINTLVLRCNLADNPSFLELLAQVKTTTQAAYDQQDLPFDRLVEALGPARQLHYNPLVQVMFALQNVPQAQWTLPGLQVQVAEVTVQSTHVDLEVYCHEVGETLQLRCIYSTDLFAQPTIQRLLSHFQNLLEGIIANPDQPIGALPLLTAPERQQLLVGWNDTATPYPKDKFIHQLFEEQVERTPDAIAVVEADQQLTYRELNGRANQLAHYLQQVGVASDMLVGLYLERSSTLIISILAILKNGAAYLPLDLSSPKERLAFMFQDAALPFLLTQTPLRADLPPSETKIIALDVVWATIGQEICTNLTLPAAQSNTEKLAYVMYTSGSTGQPKGIAIPQRGDALALEHQLYCFVGNRSHRPSLECGV